MTFVVVTGEVRSGARPILGLLVHTRTGRSSRGGEVEREPRTHMEKPRVLGLGLNLKVETVGGHHTEPHDVDGT